MEISVLIATIGVLVALTNVVVEVLKKATWDKLPTNLLALMIAEALTICAGIMYCQINAIALTWYIILALVVAGFMVAYAAMFGFDKLKEIMNWNETNKSHESA
ncbi:hypothetical protein B5G34_00860 [Flavonifractor sp. An82]|uniref:hypothetical protein n=1 Tax=Flavonifractor sp. An82 TaxID=1965660 RepID=UPI000B36F4C8|nr:hypothetical protein [Flavonifractor sp. An82]OUN23678.1 hypothetical protein B5G34_00860 [Flavonifractor sp. An82]